MTLQRKKGTVVPFYDHRKPSIGCLDKGLDEAQAKGWTVVDMKNDWKRFFPLEKAE